jgi:hypothetical protein
MNHTKSKMCDTNKIDKSPIYHEEGSGNSLIVKNMKVNSSNGEIVKLPFLHTKANIITDEISNSATIEQKIDGGFFYDVFASFDITSSSSSNVYVYTAIFTIKTPLIGRVASSISITINKDISSEKFSIQDSFDTCFVDSARNLIFEIEITSDSGVIISNYEITLFCLTNFRCDN